MQNILVRNLSYDEKRKLVQKEFRKRLKKNKKHKKYVYPEPKYDDIFYEGMKWLNEQ